MNLTVIQDTLRCKIANSKNEDIVVNENGIGIMNVKKRLALLYRNMHELEINNEGDFFVVSIVLQLRPAIDNKPFTENIKPVTETFVSNDTALSIS
jgi:LytS/YehU family sensor histidine kinase